MSKKILLMISITFIFLICLVLGGHYAKTENTFAKLNGRGLVFNCMNNYSVIKKETDEKYILKINDAICQSRKTYQDKVNEVLGNEYCELLNVIKEGKKYIKTQRELFYQTEEYLDAKKKLNECKSAYEKEDSDENKKNFHLALDNLSTLNVTINNRLKEKRDEIEQAKQSLAKLFKDNKGELLKIKKQVEQELKFTVSEIFKEYQFIVKELNQTYNENQNVDLSCFNSCIKLDTLFSPFEHELFVKIEEEKEINFKSVSSKPITNLN